MQLSRRIAISLVLLCAVSFQGLSQGLDTLWRQVMDMVSAPSRQLDPESVYQPAPSFSVAVLGDLRQAGMFQKSHLTYTDGSIEAYAITRLQGALDKEVGLQVGYGGMSLTLRRRLGNGRKNAQRSFSFDYLAPGYAVQLQYFGFKRPVEYEIGIRQENGQDETIRSGETKGPGHIKAFIADGFYAFNRQGFAFSAVYKGNVIQRQSAGSFMLGAKYLQGMVEYGSGELISSLMQGLSRQGTLQTSLGGGFSYNHVMLHKQPDNNGEGLRNLTLNATAIPMLTFINKFTSVIQRESSKGKKVTDKNVMNGKIRVNYVLRAGAIYSWDRFFVSLDGSYDSFSYTGQTDVSDYGLLFDTIESSGRFNRWSATLKLCMKF